MYFVDQKKIESTLVSMDELLKQVESHSFTTTIENYALERIVHVLIESTLDVGNMMIDGFIMRDPGSYEDIIDILIDEKVIPEQDENVYKEFIGLRKMLVNDYLHINHETVKQSVNNSVTTMKEFSSHIRSYLQNEAIVANAFLNDKEGEKHD